MDSAAPAPKALQLPVLVFGIVEVRRLQRELEALDEYMRQAAIREPGTQPAIPRVSRLLDALATDNNRNLLLEAHRVELAAFLKQVDASAPTIRISFASDPSSAFVAKLVTWLRASIHPAILLQTGLQPTIAAGCVVRTPNKQFDFSLRHHFNEQRALLTQALDVPTTQTAPAAPGPDVQPQPSPEAQS